MSSEADTLLLRGECFGRGGGGGAERRLIPRMNAPSGPPKNMSTNAMMMTICQNPGRMGSLPSPTRRADYASASSASRYPFAPKPQICPTHDGAVSDSWR